MKLPNRNELRPNKLLNSKWTAVTPVTHVVLEAVHTRRVQTLPWRALQDGALWHQGWKT